MTGEQLLKSVTSVLQEAADDGMDMFITPDMYHPAEANFLQEQLIAKGLKVEQKPLSDAIVLIIDWSETELPLDFD